MEAYIQPEVTEFTWLRCALSMILESPLYCLPIVLVTSIFLYVVIGKLWGLAWNKAWRLSDRRFLPVWLLSVFGGVFLASVNGLYGGKFFKTEVPEAMEAIMETSGDVTYEDLSRCEEFRPARPMIGRALQEVSDEEREYCYGAPMSVRLDESLICSYFLVLYKLWVAFWCLVLFLMVLVAVAAVKDIKIVKKH